MIDDGKEVGISAGCGGNADCAKQTGSTNMAVQFTSIRDPYGRAIIALWEKKSSENSKRLRPDLQDGMSRLAARSRYPGPTEPDADGIRDAMPCTVRMLDVLVCS